MTTPPTDPMAQFRAALDRVERAAMNTYTAEIHQRRMMAEELEEARAEIEALHAAALSASQADTKDAAYIAGALAMREKVALALDMSPRKVIHELSEHVRSRIKPPSAHECRQWDDAALARPKETGR